MLFGQILHGQLSLGHLLCAMYDPTNLPLKFREAGGSKTTFPAVGWLGGWVWTLKLMLSQPKLKLELELGLSLAILDILSPPPPWPKLGKKRCISYGIFDDFPYERPNFQGTWLQSFQCKQMFANVAKLSPSSYYSFSLGWLSINFNVHTHPLTQPTNRRTSSEVTLVCEKQVQSRK